MNLTTEDVLLALQKTIYEYVSDYHVSEVTEQDIHNALTGQTHRTISDLGLDSLDVIEIVMTIEDTFKVYFDDSIEEGLGDDALLETLPVLFSDYEHMDY
jgi:acyl carrier protein